MFRNFYIIFLWGRGTTSVQNNKDVSKCILCLCLFYQLSVKTFEKSETVGKLYSLFVRENGLIFI